MDRAAHHGIVPPYLLKRIVAADRLEVAGHAAKQTLLVDHELRTQRRSEAADAAAGESGPTAPMTGMRPEPEPAPLKPERTIGDAGGKVTTPGVVVRREGEPASADITVNEAYDGLGDTFELYATVYERNSIDGRGLPLNATVHYGKKYDNAFWDGTQMVFGDGDAEVFDRFTASLTVIGHELAHGVTQYTAGLVYQGQSGALNESVSDVFGSLVEQYTRKQTVTEATWLIGKGLFMPTVKGEALRSMLKPGTAYDDPVLGKDPQPDHMDHYVTTTADNGGVHINSGIPNRAFATAAVELGGYAWEHVGWIWYDALTSGTVVPRSRFAGFATATAKAAGRRFGADSPEERAVRHGWEAVGITVPAARRSGRKPKATINPR